jgi:heme/copper-type cytochrome/quinol oxidase subunit 2
MSTWGKIMNPEDEPDMHVEFVSEQFKWTARYAGLDNKLGEASFSLYGKNALGIATENSVRERLDECEKMITENGTLKEFYAKEFKINHKVLRSSLKNYEKVNSEGDTLIAFKGLRADSAIYELLIQNDWNRQENLDIVESSLTNYKANILRLNRMLNDYKTSPQKYDNGKDDIVLSGNRIKLPKGRKIKFQLRSKDVIHSAYFPHFRAQMNTVPGMKTYFTFEPKETNQEFFDKAVEEGKVYMHIKRDEEKNIIFQEERLGSTGYVLICNKICGASHYNMKMFIDVVEPEEFDEYLRDLTFGNDEKSIPKSVFENE